MVCPRSGSHMFRARPLTPAVSLPSDCLGVPGPPSSGQFSRALQLLFIQVFLSDTMGFHGATWNCSPARSVVLMVWPEGGQEEGGECLLTDWPLVTQATNIPRLLGGGSVSSPWPGLHQGST